MLNFPLIKAQLIPNWALVDMGYSFLFVASTSFSGTTAFFGATILQQSAGIHLVSQAILGEFGFCHKQVWVCLPFLDATIVFTSMFVIIDKGDDLVPKAFLHHEQPAEAAISIFEGMDAFKPDMEVQDVSQLHFFLDLVFLKQSTECLGDLLWRETILMWA